MNYFIAIGFLFGCTAVGGLFASIYSLIPPDAPLALFLLFWGGVGLIGTMLLAFLVDLISDAW